MAGAMRMSCNQAYYSNKHGKWMNYDAKHPYTRIKLEAVKSDCRKGYRVELAKDKIEIEMMMDTG